VERAFDWVRATVPACAGAPYSARVGAAHRLTSAGPRHQGTKLGDGTARGYSPFQFEGPRQGSLASRSNRRLIALYAQSLDLRLYGSQHSECLRELGGRAWSNAAAANGRNNISGPVNQESTPFKGCSEIKPGLIKGKTAYVCDHRTVARSPGGGLLRLRVWANPAIFGLGMSLEKRSKWVMRFGPPTWMATAPTS